MSLAEVILFCKAGRIMMMMIQEISLHIVQGRRVHSTQAFSASPRPDCSERWLVQFLKD